MTDLRFDVFLSYNSEDTTAVEQQVVAAFTPDDKILASASTDDTVKLWDVGNGREIHTLAGHGGDAFSPDGKTVASASADGTVRLWWAQQVPGQTGAETQESPEGTPE